RVAGRRQGRARRGARREPSHGAPRLASGPDGTRRDPGSRREPVAVSGLAPYTAAMGVCDPDLGGHAHRVGSFADTIARRLGWSDRQLEDVRLGAALHDVGKIAVPQEILCKPGTLDADEIAQIRAHPVEGARL